MSIRIAPRRLAALVHDLGMTALAIPVCYFVRFGPAGFAARGDEMVLLGAAILPIAVLVYSAVGLYSGIWRFASIPDLVSIVRAATALAILMAMLDFATRGVILVPRGVVVGYWFIQCALLGAPRLLFRIYRDARLTVNHARHDRTAAPVLVAGTDSQAEIIIRSLETGGAGPMRPVGLIAAKRAHIGQQIRNVPVRGHMDDLEKIVGDLAARGQRPTRLIVTDTVLDGHPEIEGFVATARKLGLNAERMAGPAAIDGSGRRQALSLAPIRIDDLLGRSARKLDHAMMRSLLEGERVLVTGAGGTVGSELSRQIAGMNCAGIMLVDNSELALYEIARQLASGDSGCSVEERLCDVRDRRAIASTIEEFRPDLVFHAAALKHVPMVERQPADGVLTNLVGTVNVADAAQAAGARAMILISTDKAVQPVSVLGATKRAAESYCRFLDARAAQPGSRRQTRFISVRFGNVLGSSGSVVPLFQEQLERGGPLTVTHRDMHRYFMTVSEAAGLVLMATALGLAGTDRAPVYVLDMGEPVRIADLAERMIRLAGLEAGKDIEISFTGIREGEKLVEELFDGAAPLRPTALDGILAAESRFPPPAALSDRIAELAEAARSGDRQAVLAGLCTIVPEYALARSAATVSRAASIDSASPPRLASRLA